MGDLENRRGRPPAASAAEVARAGLQLFLRTGYRDATMADVAATAGIGRSTLFRYFPGKAAIVWHGADDVVTAITSALAVAPAGRAWRPALVGALVEGFGFPDDDLEALRWRLRLITSEPDLRAHLVETMGPGVDAVATFVADRTGGAADDLVPQSVARATLAASTTALAWWAAGPADPADPQGGGRGDADPRAALRAALEAVLLPS